jgi:hypothetical protein
MTEQQIPQRIQEGKREKPVPKLLEKEDAISHWEVLEVTHPLQCSAITAAKQASQY